jgi:hypothetical protein
MDTVYYVNCAGLTGDFITRAEAEHLFATRNCEGDLQEGFTYWGAELEYGMKLVHKLVTPQAPDSIPPGVLQELESRTAKTSSVTTQPEAEAEAEAEEPFATRDARARGGAS